MLTKTKTIITALLLFITVIGAVAQEKYEFAIISQAGAYQLHISIEGKPYEMQTLPKEIKSWYDTSPLINYVSKMQQEGWEVFNAQSTTTQGNTTTFVLRKKKN